jgi:mannosyltransferase
MVKKMDRKISSDTRECDLDRGYVSPIMTVHDFSLRNIKADLLASRYLQALLIITVLGFFLRFFNLGFNSVWLDEAYTYSFSIKTLPEIWQISASGEPNPPLFYWIEHFMLIFGNNEIVLRFVPALAGTLSIPLFFLAGREFFDRNVGLIASACCAFSPFLIFFSQEARAYALMLLFVTLATFFFLRALKSGTMLNWGFFGAFSALAFWTHLYALVMIGSLIFYAFILFIRKERKNLEMLFISIVVFAVLSLPIIFITLQFFVKRVGSSPVMGIQGLSMIAAVFYRISGFNLHQISGFSILAMIMLGILFIIGIIMTFYLDSNKGIFLVSVTVFTFGISYFLSFKMPMDPRYLIFFSLILFIGIGMSYRALFIFWSNKCVVLMVIVLFLLASTPVLTHYYTSYSKTDWRGFSGAMIGRISPGDEVIFVPGYTSVPFNYYISPEKIPLPDFSEYGAGSAKDLEKYLSERKGGNRTLFFVMTGDISYVNPNGDAVVWLENNTQFIGMDVTKGICLFAYPKTGDSTAYNLNIILPSFTEASDIGTIFKVAEAGFFSRNAFNDTILVEVNNHPDGTLLSGTP